MTSTALSVSGLTKRYGRRVAVDRLDIELPTGVVAGFVGPNGSGKTTTMAMLLGLVRPTAGSATVLGSSIEEPAEYLPRVGALIESPAFYPSLSGSENLRMFATVGGHDTTSIPGLLADVGLDGRGSDRYRNYSLGMKQRLGIAAALLPDPDLLVLDEPTNGLDPAGREAMLALIHRIGTEFGISLIVCSHLLGEVERICDSLIAIDGGKLLRAARISAMTTVSDVLAVEVSEGTDELFAHLSGLGVAVERSGHELRVPLTDEGTYDVIINAVAELDLPLHMLDLRRHRVAELFASRESADVRG